MLQPNVFPGMASSPVDPNAAQNRDNSKYPVNLSTSHPMAFPHTHFDTFFLDVIPGNGVSRSVSSFFSQWMPAAFSHWVPTVLYWILLLVMLLGIAGAVIPAVPGPTLIVGAIAVAGLIYGWHNVAIPLVVACIVLALCFAIEYLAGVLGGQKAGASHWGQIGSMVGPRFFWYVTSLARRWPTGGYFLWAFYRRSAGRIALPTEETQRRIGLGLGHQGTASRYRYRSWLGHRPSHAGLAVFGRSDRVCFYYL
jgi:Protein of unknown function (DUF456)